MALAALLATTFAAHANGLGEISVKSHLGERLRVEIQLRGADGKARGPECFHLSNALADNSGLPHLRHAGINVLQNPPRLVITSRDAIFEPAIEVAVFYGCGVFLSRSYTVLLSPRESALPIAAPVADAGNDRQAPPRTETKPPPVANPKARVLFAGETPEEMAQRLYPRSEAYRKRFLRELVALNPGSLSDDSLDRPLPDGTSLKIPPRFVPVKKPAPATPPPPAAAAPATAEKAAPTEPAAAPAPATTPAAAAPADRLVLSAPTDVPAATPEQAQLEMDQRLRDVIGQARTLSDELAAMQREFPNPPPEVKTRLLEMETRLARMELAAVRIKLSSAAPAAAARSAADSTPAVPAPAADAGAAPTPPPAPVASPAPAPAAEKAEAAAPAPVAPPAEESNGFWWGLAVLLAFAAALVAYLIRNAARRSERNALMPARDSVPPPATAAAAAVRPVATGAPARPAPLGDDFDRPEPPPEFERSMPGDVEIVEVAHVLAIFGRTPAAIEVLTEFIGQNPEKALNPSLYLLKLYKQTNKTDEFRALAAKLHTEFNVVEIRWEDPIDEIAPVEPSARNYREVAKELEKIPHLYSRISEKWGSRECLDYLHELLRDNRAGQRQGLPLAVTNEVLNLIAMLQREFPNGTAVSKD